MLINVPAYKKRKAETPHIIVLFQLILYYENQSMYNDVKNDIKLLITCSPIAAIILRPVFK